MIVLWCDLVLSRGYALPESYQSKSNNSKVSQKVPPGGSLTLKDPGCPFIRDLGSDPFFFPGQGKRSGNLVNISEIMARILPLNLNSDNLSLHLTGDVDGITISVSGFMSRKWLKLSYSSPGFPIDIGSFSEMRSK